MISTKITTLFGIETPIIQGGMVWCSGWKLVSAVSNCGGLGLLGAGSMYPHVLREHIQKTKIATSKPFGVNIPLLYPNIEELINIIIEEDVKIVFTSAGNPQTWTKLLKKNGIKVVHVVSNTKFAKKAEDAGVDAIVAEGFEAGGHNGREETTTLCLIPEVCKIVKIPVIAAGGIGSGEAIFAAMALGAEGVQIGSLFAAAAESSAHLLFKQKITETNEGGTELIMRHLIPVRIIKNLLWKELKTAELSGTSNEELLKILGKGKAKKGMFEGDIENGELEIGQIASQIKDIKSVSEIFEDLKTQFQFAVGRLKNSIGEKFL